MCYSPKAIWDETLDIFKFLSRFQKKIHGGNIDKSGVLIKHFRWELAATTKTRIIVYNYQIFLAVLSMLFIFASLSGASLSADESAGRKEVKQEKNLYSSAEITIKIVPSTSITFGYDILLYGRPLVHQPNVPGLPGNKGFTTREKAQTVAEFVVMKIRNNEMPPTVTIEDLNNMGVLKWR